VIYVGIDPGKQGAIARIDADSATAFPIPVFKPAKGKPEYDVGAIRDAMLELATGGPEIFVMVEDPGPISPRVKAGSLAQYNRGVTRGWDWLLMGMGIPHQLVKPKAWQKVMHEGCAGDDTKLKSITAAQRLFPNVDLRRTERCRTQDDGMAEALLLAEYGRRTHNGRSSQEA